MEPAQSIQSSSVSFEKRPKKQYRTCTRCVMDTSYPGLSFDENGMCAFCSEYDEKRQARVFDADVAEEKLGQLVERIQAAGKGRDYDCIVGVSGGVDSTYVAYRAKSLGLRPLAVHFDNGWNSELAVSNIEKVLNTLDIDLYTYVVDWEEFKDLQLSFLKSSTPDAEVPTDHGIFACLMRVANEQGIRFVLTGMNYNTESINMENWSYGHADWKYIRSVHTQFGSLPLNTFPHYSIPYLIYTLGVRRVKFAALLNYLSYDKPTAMKILEDELGWQPYGGKHHESIYTRFFQSYILPVKFDIDKRKAHLSSLILSSGGAFTRDDAIAELEKDICESQLVRDDKEYVVKKFGLTEEAFDEIMRLPVMSFRDYPSNYRLVKFLKRTQHVLRSLGLYHK